MIRCDFLSKGREVVVDIEEMNPDILGSINWKQNRND